MYKYNFRFRRNCEEEDIEVFFLYFIFQVYLFYNHQTHHYTLHSLPGLPDFNVLIDFSRSLFYAYNQPYDGAA